MFKAITENMAEGMLGLVRDPLERAIRFGDDPDYETVPFPEKDLRFYKLTHDSMMGYRKVRAYLGWEPSGHLHWGNEVTAQILMCLENRYGVQPLFLNATEHAFLNNKGTREQIAYYAEILNDEIKKLFISPEILYGSEFQLSFDFNDQDSREDLLRKGKGLRSYKDYLFAGLRRIPKSELDDAASEVVTPKSTGSAFIYSALQWTDVRWLFENYDVWFDTGGSDQRKIHKLVWDYFPGLDWELPFAIHAPILPSLSGRLVNGRIIKMSKSEDEEYTLYLDDTPELIEMKMKKAFCAPCSETITEQGRPIGLNPVAELLRLVVSNHSKKIKVERPSKYGGDLEVEPMELWRMFNDSREDKKTDRYVHPVDFKDAVTNAMINLTGKLGLPPRNVDEEKEIERLGMQNKI